MITLRIKFLIKLNLKSRFAVKNVVKPFGILFSNYENNSKSTNHNIIKMFHRIAVDCGTPAILFQAAIFRVFQRIWNDLKAKPEDANLRELAKFGKFILRQVFILLLGTALVITECHVRFTQVPFITFVWSRMTGYPLLFS